MVLHLDPGCLSNILELNRTNRRTTLLMRQFSMVFTGKYSSVSVVLTAVLIVLLFVSKQSSGGGLKSRVNPYGDKRFSAALHYVADGDSFVVKNENDVHIAIRLWDVDAPEFDQPHAKDSKRGLERLLRGKDIEIVPKYVDRFGRLVAVAEAGNSVVNSALITGGYVWVHPYFCREAVCDQWYHLQKKAQKRKRGLWADGDPVEPWVWKMKK